MGQTRIVSLEMLSEELVTFKKKGQKFLEKRKSTYNINMREEVPQQFSSYHCLWIAGSLEQLTSLHNVWSHMCVSSQSNSLLDVILELACVQGVRNMLF